MNAIDCRDLVKTFEKTGPNPVRALDGVSIAIRPNEFLTLLGPSGCGKTTLLRLIGGFETQDSGTIHLNGAPLDGLPPYRRPVNTVFQSYAVFPHMTVAQNVAFGLQMQRRPKPEIRDRVTEMLNLVKLQGLGGRRPAQLSGGQQQRVALARALAGAPKVLLLDEPLSALDLKLRTDMQLELKRLQSELGITFIFVTHDQHEALTMSDRIAVMSAGRILQLGTPQDIYERPATRFVAEFIGETILLEATQIGPRSFRLPAGDIIESAECHPGEAPVTLAIRPERAALTEVGAGTLDAKIDQVVYLGTDTTYHLLGPGRIRLRVREQNRAGARPRRTPGEAVGILVPPEAVRVLPK